MSRRRTLCGLTFLGAAILAAALWGQFARPGLSRAAAAQADQSEPPSELLQMQARLSMFMADYHSSNLWFAGRAQNWPLAQYYWEKVNMHMELSADADPSGEQRERLEKVRKAIEESPAMQVDEAIARQDLRAFGDAYRNLLQGCYNCHKVAGYPELRPRMPVPPSSSMINADPRADWPR